MNAPTKGVQICESSARPWMVQKRVMQKLCVGVVPSANFIEISYGTYANNLAPASSKKKSLAKPMKHPFMTLLL